MNRIITLNNLISRINNSYKKNNCVSSLYNIIYNYKGDDWKEFNLYSENPIYKKSLVYTNDLYDLYVISWMPYSYSKIHDHSSNGCLFKILNGELNEKYMN